jgi:hypothetical protein
LASIIPPERIEAGAREGRALRRAGIGDNDRKRPIRLDCVEESSSDLSFVSHVCDDRMHARILRRERVERRPCPPRNRHFRAGICQHGGDRRADAGAAACDERVPALQAHRQIFITELSRRAARRHS